MITSFSSTKDNSYIKYPWVQFQNVYVKGSAYLGDELYEEERLAKIFKDVFNKDDFLCILKKLNGFYAVIVDLKDLTLSATDLVASTPMLYSVSKDLIIGDSYEMFVSGGVSFSQNSIRQLLVSGYVYGDKTLVEGVFQLPAGTLLVFDKKCQETEILPYYEYIPDVNNECSMDRENYVEELHGVHIEVFQRMIRSLKERQVVLPLSGGYDSRLVLEMLVGLGYKKILCVTWGKEKDWEVQIARKVAKALGVKWVLVNHQRCDWWEWYKKGGFKRQLQFCGALGAIPYIQENVLVNYLEKNKIIDSDAVFLSGNSGDFIEGEHIPSVVRQDDHDSILSYIKYKHMRLNSAYSYSEILRVIKDEILCFEKRGVDINCFFEFWEWKERQSKFVTGCVKPFESCGYEWRMPFWDKKIMEFWRNVPIDMKRGRLLFFEYSKKYMKVELDEANPHIPKMKKYAERVCDSRYGCYVNKSIFIEGFVKSDAKIFDKKIKSYVKSKKLILHKINGLVALDVFSHIHKYTR